MNMTKKLILTLITLGLVSATHTFAADTAVTIESRTADDSVNSNTWMEVSGTWGKSKNKTRVDDNALAGKNVSICETNIPAPAFKISPEGLNPARPTRWK